MAETNPNNLEGTAAERTPPAPGQAPVVLSYQRPVPSRKWAKGIRIVMLIVAIAAILMAALLIFNPVLEINERLGAGALGTPFGPIDGTQTNEVTQHRYVAEAILYLGLFLLMQWLFLSPRGRWQISLSLDGPLPRRAALAAGFIGMLLSIGLIATLMEIPDWWIRCTTIPQAHTDPEKRVQSFRVMWVVMSALWSAWTFVFWRYGKSLDRYSALRKIFRWLLAGTVLELLIATPAHAAIIYSRGDECYCERGTYTGIAFGCTAALWLFGPGAILLFLREKRRRTVMNT